MRDTINGKSEKVSEPGIRAIREIRGRPLHSVIKRNATSGYTVRTALSRIQMAIWNKSLLNKEEDESIGMSDSQTTIQQLKDKIQQFTDERSWSSFHNLKNLSMSLAIEVGELMEHTQWLTTEQAVEMECSSEVAEEVADVLSYLLAIANVMNIDLATALEAKLEKNCRKYPVGSERTRQGLPTLLPPTS